MSKVTVEMLEYIADKIENTGSYEVSVDAEYSGRGMYGRTTPALITDAPALFVGMLIGEAIAEEQGGWHAVYADDDLLGRTDSMGLGKVYY